MSLQVPADIEFSVRAYLADGRFKSEDDVLREAMAALERQDRELAGILEGMDDEAAGRVLPAREVVAAAKRKLGLAE